MSKPNLGKTKTIKKRAIYVYLPSLELADEWKERAKTARQSISKFVVERVLDSINNEEGDSASESRVSLVSNLNEANDRIKNLEKENRMLKSLSESLDAELRRYHAGPFLDPGFTGLRQTDPAVIDLLRSSNQPLTQNELLTQLNVKSNATDIIAGISQQLEYLEQVGLVECLGRKWRWKG